MHDNCDNTILLIVNLLLIFLKKWECTSLMTEFQMMARPKSEFITGTSPRDMIFTADSMVPQDFCCAECRKMLKEPILTGCCGKNMCKGCVVVEKGGVCPLCDSDGLSFVLDRRVIREITNTLIYCRYHEEGCSWHGTTHETKGHLEKDCMFVQIACFVCKGTVKRCDITDHLKAKCYIEWYECSYCKQIIPKHSKELHIQETCQEYVFPCPNGCGAEVKRANGTLHKESCPDLVIECQFRKAGCEAVFMRKQEHQHITEKHTDHSLLVFSSLQGQMERVQDELSEMKKEMRRLKEETDATASKTVVLEKKLEHLTSSHKDIANLLQSELQFFVNHPNILHSEKLSIECMRIQLALLNDPNSVALSSQHSLVFRLPMYSYYKMQTVPWYSSPFTVRGGYQMCIAVYLNGDQEGRGTHISIHIHLIAGSMDNKLTWPLMFHDLITISLVNQSLEASMGSKSGSPSIKKRSKPVHASTDGEWFCAIKQPIRNVVHSLNRVKKPVGEIGLSFGYIALFYAQCNVTSSILVNNSLVFMLELQNQNLLTATI